MGNHFKLINVLDLKKADEDFKSGKEVKIPESDFAQQLDDDTFLQYEFVEEDDQPTIDVKPGIFEIVKGSMGLTLEKTRLLSEAVLESYNNTVEIIGHIDSFFNKVDVYKKYGIFNKRNILLTGTPGSGKSLGINRACQKYLEGGDAAVIFWKTDVLAASAVSSFISKFNYVGVSKLILVAEDVGGVELEHNGNRGVESGTLSLLDNTQQIFTLPTVIILTTNHPENLPKNLTNRPGRIDSIVTVNNPSANQRIDLLRFFSQGTATETELNHIKKEKFSSFSVAHIKEVLIRKEIHELSFIESMEQLLKQLTLSETDFKSETERKMGL